MSQPFFTTYTQAELRNLFNGRRVSPILPYESRDESLTGSEEDVGHLSVSGAQEKWPMVIRKGKIVQFTGHSGEHATHIMKPLVPQFPLYGEMPANEYLSMQLARHVFGIETADCCLCFYGNGQPAYLTRRFDILPNGSRLMMEDFASVLNKDMRGGSNFKYDSSYEDIAEAIKGAVSASSIELERFFLQVVYNFLISNGDAHIKNFSLLETSSGDMRLSPAYDLMCTSLHVEDNYFALRQGLYASRSTPALPTGMTFLEWGRYLGIPLKRLQRIRGILSLCKDPSEKMIGDSWLSERAKELYLLKFRNRYERLLHGWPEET